MRCRQRMATQRRTRMRCRPPMRTQRWSLPWSERIELDIWYVENRSLRLDLRILARTVRLLVTGHGLYSEDRYQGWG